MTRAPDAPPALPDRYAVLGHPVAHSQSPFIHAAFARQTGQHIDYGRIECALDGFEAGVRTFIASADPAKGLGPARGCNITVPFKFQVLPLARQVSERAALAQAANVLRFDADGWFADNSDGIGLVRDVQQGAGLALAGSRVLLVGAGGAAAGVLGPLISSGARAITVANRSPERAAALVQRHLGWAQQHGVALRATGLQDCSEGYDLVLNSSASSLAGAPVPVPARVLAPGSLALDMMYGPAAQPFLAWAEAHGARGRDGLGMLVEQAAEAFWLWRGVRPETASVLAALRARLAAAT
ncbi:MAG: shikimate dehydrogenase [Burkholderiales bacterium]|nr:shikimate dehydrogenase [Burkholderiales bacterium]